MQRVEECEMVNGAKVALAVGAGYFLGRTRKMRIALMLAAAGLTGKFPTTPSALAAQGLKSLGATADVSELSQQLRGEVLNAAKAAALAAATKQVDSLNDRLQGVTSAVDTEQVLDDVGDTIGSVGDAVGGVGDTLRTGGRSGRRRSAERDKDLYDDEDREPLDVDEEDVYDEDREPDDADFDEDEDASAFDEEDMDDDEPADDDRRVRSGRRATRQATGPRTSGRRSSRAASDDGNAAGSRRATRTATKSAPVRRGR
jgi:hypothetical protein